MKKLLLTFGILIWAICIGIGFNKLMSYAARPGLPANVSSKLPVGIFPESGSQLPKLLLFVHPQCSCSRATLHELARIVAENPNRAEIKISFYKPIGEVDAWTETDLRQQAKEISGVEISTMNENEMEKFGVITSGQTLLYDKSGELVFSGGITTGRGHEGPSRGSEMIETYLQGGDPAVNQTPVFGCLLTSPENLQNRTSN